MTDRASSAEEIQARIAVAAVRALAEAQSRRAKDVSPPLAVEKGGQAGPEPTRYGDWEKKGRICDF